MINWNNCNTIESIRKIATVSFIGKEECKESSRKTHTIGSTNITGFISTAVNSKKLVIESNDLEQFRRTIECLIKKQEAINKIKSLIGIIKNELKNLSNSKSTPESWTIIIQKDENLGVQVMNMMVKANIIEVSQDNKYVKLISHKFEEFYDPNFDDKRFKENVGKTFVININYHSKYFILYQMFKFFILM